MANDRVIFITDGKSMGGKETWLQEVIPRLTKGAGFDIHLYIPASGRLEPLIQDLSKYSEIWKYTSPGEIFSISSPMDGGKVKTWFLHVGEPIWFRKFVSFAEGLKNVWFFLHDTYFFNFRQPLKAIYETVLWLSKPRFLKGRDNLGLIVGTKAAQAFYIQKGIKTIYLPHGVDTARFQPASLDERTASRARLGLPQDKFIAIYPARYVPEKNHLLALKLAASMPDVHFVFAGSGSDIYRSTLKKIASAYRLTNVSFLEHIEAPELLYKSADITIFPSLADNPGLVLLESMASSVPVVSVNFPPQAEVLGDAGLLSPPRVDEFRRKIRLLKENASLYNKLAQLGRERVVKNYDIRITAELTQEILGQAP